MQNKWASHRRPYAPTLIARPENPDRSPLAALGPDETANVPAFPPTDKPGADTVAWPYIGAALLALLTGLGLWLVLSKPLMANPLLVLARLKSDSIPESTLALMAAMLPVVVSMCIVLAVAIVFFAFAVFSNQKRYLTLIERESHKIEFAKRGVPTDAAKPVR